MHRNINLSYLLLFLVMVSSNSCTQGVNTEKRHVDIILEADHILTMNSSDTILKNAAIAINNGVILDIDDKKIIDQKYRTDQRISG